MDDVRAVLDAAGSSRATLFGISEGGPMTLLFAATHPDRVERLILANSYASDPFEDTARMADFVRRFWGQGRALGTLAPSWTVPADREFLARFERQGATPESAAALVAMNAGIDVSATLSSITAPTLVLHRTDDPVIHFDRGEALAAGIPGAELVPLSGRDHLVWADPHEMLNLVERFVTGVAPSPATPERVLLSLMFVDVVGSTEQAVEMGDGPWTALLGQVRDEIVSEIHRLGGRRINTTGDGTLAGFDGPARAVWSALGVVDRVALHGVQVRCGVHTSEIELVGDDVAGIGVHVGSRVESLARPGEVLVTRTVRDLVVGSDLRFESRGVHELRGVPDTWELFAAVG